jgi:hypothetical protein
VGAWGGARVHDDDAFGRRRARAQERDESGEELDLTEEQLALAPVVCRAGGVWDMAVGGAGR